MYLVCGEALFDVFVDPNAAKRSNRMELHAVAGGSPFNVAVGLRRLGVPAALFTGLSGDPMGVRLRQVLTEERVSDRYLIEFDAPTTLAMIAIGPDGSPSYSFRGEGCADRLPRLDQLPALHDSICGIHIGSYSLVVQPIADTIHELVIRESAGRLISLDPNVRLNVEPNLPVWRARIERLASHAHLIKVSLEDIELLYPGHAPEAIAEGWLKNQCELVLLTRGGQGAQAFSRNNPTVTVAARPVELRDTVGAGDTFQAAVLTWLYERKLCDVRAIAGLNAEALGEMLEFSIEAAAITCTRTGPDLPFREEITKLAPPAGVHR